MGSKPYVIWTKISDILARKTSRIWMVQMTGHPTGIIYARNFGVFFSRRQGAGSVMVWAAFFYNGKVSFATMEKFLLLEWKSVFYYNGKVSFATMEKCLLLQWKSVFCYKGKCLFLQGKSVFCYNGKVSLLFTSDRQTSTLEYNKTNTLQYKPFAIC
ncbi:hypothetical protein AVEN_116149-1 [Araneus ventricosus]|uniref:Uncharacterized protein n=1 Tax=Araneus ventricosus TaxID=182803 RepID=A0A4Y2PMB7_ARAVE|nr:hypothetical protein AVEN_116149-1 [Araneus ventricosus]